MKIFFTICLFCWFVTIGSPDDERIWLFNAKINGQPVRFAFDSGSFANQIIYSTTAQRLGLKVIPPDPNQKIRPGDISLATTELCDLEFETDYGTIKARAGVNVLEIPAYSEPSEDGIIGWPALSNNIIYLDAISNRVDFLTNVPAETTNWLQFPIQTISGDLVLVIASDKKTKTVVAIDTGSTDGAILNPQKWHEWKLAHTNQPITLNAYYTPNPGLVVAEQSWADKISLGSLTLNDVPIEQCNSGSIALFSSTETKYEATLGLAALKRLDIIFDGKHGIAYLRPKTTPPVPYIHNRLGASFVPLDMQSNDLIAHVVDGGPAYEAGIREGDILLEEDGRDVTNWRDPNIKINAPFREQPAGTKIELMLKRGDKVFKTTATLRNILPPDAASSIK